MSNNPYVDSRQVIDTQKNKPFELINQRFYNNISLAKGWKESTDGLFNFMLDVELPVGKDEVPITLDYSPEVTIPANANASCRPSNFPMARTIEINKVRVYAYRIPDAMDMLPVTINMRSINSSEGTTNGTYEPEDSILNKGKIIVQSSASSFIIPVDGNNYTTKDFVATTVVTAFRGEARQKIRIQEKKTDLVYNIGGTLVTLNSDRPEDLVVINNVYADENLPSATMSITIPKGTPLEDKQAYMQFNVSPLGSTTSFTHTVRISLFTDKSDDVISAIHRYELDFPSLSRSTNNVYKADGKTIPIQGFRVDARAISPNGENIPVNGLLNIRSMDGELLVSQAMVSGYTTINPTVFNGHTNLDIELIVDGDRRHESITKIAEDGIDIIMNINPSYMIPTIEDDKFVVAPAKATAFLVAADGVYVPFFGSYRVFAGSDLIMEVKEPSDFLNIPEKRYENAAIPSSYKIEVFDPTDNFTGKTPRATRFISITKEGSAELPYLMEVSPSSIIVPTTSENEMQNEVPFEVFIMKGSEDVSTGWEFEIVSDISEYHIDISQEGKTGKFTLRQFRGTQLSAVVKFKATMVEDSAQVYFKELVIAKIRENDNIGNYTFTRYGTTIGDGSEEIVFTKDPDGIIEDGMIWGPYYGIATSSVNEVPPVSQFKWFDSEGAIAEPGEDGSPGAAYFVQGPSIIKAKAMSQGIAFSPATANYTIDRMSNEAEMPLSVIWEISHDGESWDEVSNDVNGISLAFKDGVFDLVNTIEVRATIEAQFGSKITTYYAMKTVNLVYSDSPDYFSRVYSPNSEMEDYHIFPSDSFGNIIKGTVMSGDENPIMIAAEVYKGGTKLKYYKLGENLIKYDLRDMVAANGSEITVNKTFPIDVFKGGRNLFTSKGWEFYNRYATLVSHDGTKSLIFEETPGAISSSVAIKNVGYVTTPGRYIMSGFLKINGAIPEEDYFLNITTRSSQATVERTYNPATGYFTVSQVVDYYSWTIHAAARGKTSESNRTIEISNIKYEKGDIATDWSPAPEDGYNYNGSNPGYHIQAKGGSAFAKAYVPLGNIKDKNLTFDGRFHNFADKFRVNAPSIGRKSDYIDKLEDVSINLYGAAANEAQYQLELEDNNGVIDTVASGISAKEMVVNKDNGYIDTANMIKDDFSDFTPYRGATVRRNKTFPIDVFKGGRNLIPSSVLGGENYTTKEFEFSGWAVPLINTEDTLSILESGEKYTISYDMELTETTDVPTLFSLQTGLFLYSPGRHGSGSFAYTSNLVNKGDKYRCVQTFTAPKLVDHRVLMYSNRYTTNGNSPIGLDTLKVTNLKLEKGDIATEYSPAPEDGYGLDLPNGAYHIQTSGGEHSVKYVYGKSNTGDNELLTQVTVHSFNEMRIFNGKVQKILPLNETYIYDELDGNRGRIDFQFRTENNNYIDLPLDFIASDPSITRVAETPQLPDLTNPKGWYSLDLLEPIGSSLIDFESQGDFAAIFDNVTTKKGWVDASFNLEGVEIITHKFNFETVVNSNLKQPLVNLTASNSTFKISTAKLEDITGGNWANSYLKYSNDFEAQNSPALIRGTVKNTTLSSMDISTDGINYMSIGYSLRYPNPSYSSYLLPFDAIESFENGEAAIHVVPGQYYLMITKNKVDASAYTVSNNEVSKKVEVDKDKYYIPTGGEYSGHRVSVFKAPAGSEQIIIGNQNDEAPRFYKFTLLEELSEVFNNAPELFLNGFLNLAEFKKIANMNLLPIGQIAPPNNLITLETTKNGVGSIVISPLAAVNENYFDMSMADTNMMIRLTTVTGEMFYESLYRTVYPYTDLNSTKEDLRDALSGQYLYPSDISALTRSVESVKASVREINDIISADKEEELVSDGGAPVDGKSEIFFPKNESGGYYLNIHPSIMETEGLSPNSVFGTMMQNDKHYVLDFKLLKRDNKTTPVDNNILFVYKDMIANSEVSGDIELALDVTKRFTYVIPPSGESTVSAAVISEIKAIYGVTDVKVLFPNRGAAANEFSTYYMYFYNNTIKKNDLLLTDFVFQELQLPVSYSIRKYKRINTEPMNISAYEFYDSVNRAKNNMDASEEGRIPNTNDIYSKFTTIENEISNIKVQMARVDSNVLDEAIFQSSQRSGSYTMGYNSAAGWLSSLTISPGGILMKGEKNQIIGSTSIGALYGKKLVMGKSPNNKDIEEDKKYIEETGDSKGLIAVWEDGKWSSVLDSRGQQFFRYRTDKNTSNLTGYMIMNSTEIAAYQLNSPYTDVSGPVPPDVLGLSKEAIFRINDNGSVSIKTLEIKGDSDDATADFMGTVRFMKYHTKPASGKERRGLVLIGIGGEK